MNLNPCEKEILERDNAQRDVEEIRKQIEDHKKNPLDWDTSSPPYRQRLAKLENELIKREKILEGKEQSLADCGG